MNSRLSLAERASYGFGDFGYSLAYNMAGAFLLYYYTAVVGLPAAAVGTIFLIARLLDAVIDPLVGIAVDKTRSRWGRTRPYFLFTAVPYALVTFKALGIIMSAGSIPYTALMPTMTDDPADRLRLGGLLWLLPALFRALRRDTRPHHLLCQRRGAKTLADPGHVADGVGRAAARRLHRAADPCTHRHPQGLHRRNRAFARDAGGHGRTGCAPDLHFGALAVPPLLIPYFAFSIITSVTITGIFSMAAATADYHQALFGVRHEGLLSSGISTSTKVGMALGSALAAFILAWAGYQPEAVSEAARATIRSAYFLAAGGLLALQAGAVWFWPMDGDWRTRLKPEAP